MRIYAKDEVCGFRLTRAAWGAFSNFQPLAVPIAAGPWTFPTSGHLYQAAKFGARPDIQQRVAKAPTARDAVAIGRTLRGSLRDILREDLGQTYTVSVRLAQSFPPRGEGRIRVSFGASPDNIQPMIERVLQEVGRLQQVGPSADLTSRAREAARRGYETALAQNPYWLQRMRTVHMLDRNPFEILTRTERIDAITPAVVQEAFKKYFPPDRYTVVTLVPEKTQ